MKLDKGNPDPRAHLAAGDVTDRPVAIGGRLTLDEQHSQADHSQHDRDEDLAVSGEGSDGVASRAHGHISHRGRGRRRHHRDIAAGSGLSHGRGRGGGCLIDSGQKGGSSSSRQDAGGVAHNGSESTDDGARDRARIRSLTTDASVVGTTRASGQGDLGGDDAD